MSWSANLPNPATREELPGALGILVPSPVPMPPEAIEQFKLAKNLAWQAVKSGALGGDGRRYTVQLSGHANPGHMPAEGCVGDYLNVTIRQHPPSE